MSHSGDRKTFPAFGNAKKVSFQEPVEFSDMGECEEDLWVAGKMSWYQQRNCQSLVMEFSDGKLEQKRFFFFSQCRFRLAMGFARRWISLAMGFARR